MDMRIMTLEIKCMLESNPMKLRFCEVVERDEETGVGYGLACVYCCCVWFLCLIIAHHTIIYYNMCYYIMYTMICICEQ